jgi:hypothetical protein
MRPVQPDLFGRSSTCRVCGRPLSDPISVALGIGPVCGAGTHAALLKEEPVESTRLVEPRLDINDPEAEVILERHGDAAWTNVPQVLVDHSPSGFEWGYGGSGPADLALNLMALFYPLKPGDEGVRLYRGARCSWEAWQLHQQFKWRFIASAPRAGGRLPLREIRAWLDSPEVQKRLAFEARGRSLA